MIFSKIDFKRKFLKKTRPGMYLLKNSREMRRAPSARPQGVRDANFLPWMALCREAQDGRERLLRIPKGGDVQQGACYPLLKSYRGITLVEILVSLAVASLVMLPFILLFGVSEKVAYKSINEVVATNLAMQKLEELKSRPFEQLRKIIEAHAPDPVDGPFQEVILPLELNENWNSPGVKYSREARLSFFPFVNPVASTPDYELQKRRIRIRVIVKFFETAMGGTPREKNFELASLVGDETLGAGLNASFPTWLKP